MKRKINPDTHIRVRDVYSLVCDKVDEGVAYGLRRSIKHGPRNLEDDADFEAVRMEVTNRVMGELCDLLDFGPWEP